MMSIRRCPAWLAPVAGVAGLVIAVTMMTASAAWAQAGPDIVYALTTFDVSPSATLQTIALLKQYRDTAHKQAGNISVAGQEGFERDRRSGLAGADQSAGQLENTLVDRLKKMLRFKEVRNPVERLVIDEDGAKQSLFGFDIVRSRPERRLRGDLLAGGRIENWHGPGQRNQTLWPFCGAPPQPGGGSVEIRYSTSRRTQRQQRLMRNRLFR